MLLWKQYQSCYRKVSFESFHHFRNISQNSRSLAHDGMAGVADSERDRRAAAQASPEQRLGSNGEVHLIVEACSDDNRRVRLSGRSHRGDRDVALPIDEGCNALRVPPAIGEQRFFDHHRAPNPQEGLNGSTFSGTSCNKRRGLPGT